YQFGDGIVKTEVLAFECYKRIADKDLVAGEFRIGYFYNEGIGIEKDSKLANYWYKRAADNGNLMAMHNLALIYKNGDGVKEDNIAQHNLDLMYENGDGIMQDIDQAIYWYKESVKQGYQGAQSKLEKLRIRHRCPPKLFLHKF